MENVVGSILMERASDTEFNRGANGGVRCCGVWACEFRGTWRAWRFLSIRVFESGVEVKLTAGRQQSQENIR